MNENVTCEAKRTEDPILMLFVDLGLAFRVAGEVLRRDLLLRRPLLVKLAAHLKHARYLRAIHLLRWRRRQNFVLSNPKVH